MYINIMFFYPNDYVVEHVITYYMYVHENVYTISINLS